MERKSYLRTIVLSSVLVFTSSIYAAVATESITVDAKVKPGKELSMTEKVNLARTANRMLKHTYQAEVALREKHYKKAIKNIKQARLLKKIVQNVMPKFSINSTITSGKLVYKDSDPIQPLVVQLYDELDRVELNEPLAAAKRAKNLTKAKAKKVDGVQVDDVEYRHTTAFLDVAFADRMLTFAQKNIKRKKYKLAKADLESALLSVSFEYDLSDAPLQAIAEDIALANEYVENDKYEDAKILISKTSKMLERISDDKFLTKKTEKEIERMSDELSDIKNDVDAKNKSSISAKLKKLWFKVRTWMS